MHSSSPTATEDLAIKLTERIGQSQHVAIAFSGGVDSGVVAAAAQSAKEMGLVKSAIAITAISPSVASWQIQTAKDVAGQIGIEHREMPTREVEKPAYQRNDHRRCFHCKQTLYRTMTDVVSQLSISHRGYDLFSGTNADDAGDYRPGIEAGTLSKVKTPLLDLGINKKQVRQLATHYGLSNADLPASPCLASRIAYGTEVTVQRLKRIDQAEDILRGLDFDVVRVRTRQVQRHGEPIDLAVVEVEQSQVERLIQLNLDESISKQLKQYGFDDVEIDQEGFRSGKLNDDLNLAALTAPKESQIA